MYRMRWEDFVEIRWRQHGRDQGQIVQVMFAWDPEGEPRLLKRVIDHSDGEDSIYIGNMPEDDSDDLFELVKGVDHWEEVQIF